MDFTCSLFCNVELTLGGGCPTYQTTYTPSSLCIQVLLCDLSWPTECVQKWSQSIPNKSFHVGWMQRKTMCMEVVIFQGRRSLGPWAVAWRRPTCWPGAPALDFMQERNQILLGKRMKFQGLAFITMNSTLIWCHFFLLLTLSCQQIALTSYQRGKNWILAWNHLPKVTWLAGGRHRTHVKLFWLLM